VIADVHDVLRAISQTGRKGDFEQESVPLEQVLATIRTMRER